MSLWLFKQEPDCYSYSQLEADGETTWDGVSNALALKHLRTAKAGDKVFFYHTGKEKAIVGIMTIASAAQTRGEGDKSVSVVVKPKTRLKSPVTLAQIKADESLATWDLVRISRLSIVPVTKDQWDRVMEMAGE